MDAIDIVTAIAAIIASVSVVGGAIWTVASLRQCVSDLKDTLGDLIVTVKKADEKLDDHGNRISVIESKVGIS